MLKYIPDPSPFFFTIKKQTCAYFFPNAYTVVLSFKHVPILLYINHVIISSL